MVIPAMVPRTRTVFKVVLLKIGENGSDGNQVCLKRFKRIDERPAQDQRTD